MKTKVLLMGWLALSLIFFTGCGDDDEDDKVIALQSIKISPTSVALVEGATAQLTATAEPTGAVMTPVWSSENDAIASVDSKGLVTAVKSGKTSIVVKSGNIKASVEVTVSSKVVELTDMTVDPEEVTLKIGEKQEITVTLIPEDATVSVSLESDNTDVATVDGKVITAVAKGEATITVTAGEITKTVIVTVNNPDVSERELWTKFGASSEWQDSYLVGNVFDGNLESYWHSDAAGTMPQWISIDMGSTKNIQGFLFTNRQEKTQTARPKHVVFEISDDGENWEKVYENAELPNLLQQQILALDEVKTARYFKVTVNNTWSDANYSYIAELDIYSGTAPTPNPGPEIDAKPKWTAEVSSILNDGMGAGCLVDGDPSTAWHSSTSDPQPWAIIDFKEQKTLHGIYYWRRNVDFGPSPKNIRFSVGNTGSKDAGDWTVLLEEKELENPEEQYKQTLNAPAPQSGQYLLIEILSNWAEAPYSFIGDINIKETAVVKPPFDLKFSESTNALTVEKVDDYYVLKATGGDPYVMLESFVDEIGAKKAFVRMKYKASVAITTAEWFCFPKFGGFYSSGQVLTFDVADEWTDWSYEFEVKGGLGTGNAIRFDLPDNYPADFYVKDLKLTIE